jgi:hypothetical protein
VLEEKLANSSSFSDFSLRRPIKELSAWEQREKFNAYMLGEMVSHNGQDWMSIVEDNTWEPGVYGWTEV